MALQRKRQSAVRSEQQVEQIEPQPVVQEEAPPGPRVTAIIVACNQVEELRACLNALERSTDRQLLEVLVMDNGSFDATSEIDSEYPGVTVLRLPKNFGRTRAMNILTRTAKAELLFFLSPRIEVQPDTVARLADALEASETAAATCPLIVDETGAPVNAYFKLPDSNVFASIWSSGTGLVPETIDEGSEAQPVEYAMLDALMITKYFVRGLNYLDDKYGEYWADAELSWRIRRAGRSILVLPAIRVTRRGREPEPRSSAARAALAVDRGNGAAVFTGKHSGVVSGLLLRLRFALSALGAAITFQEPGYNFSRLIGILSGSKIDGNQSAVL